MPKDAIFRLDDIELKNKVKVECSEYNRGRLRFCVCGEYPLKLDLRESTLQLLSISCLSRSDVLQLQKKFLSLCRGSSCTIDRKSFFKSLRFTAIPILYQVLDSLEPHDHCSLFPFSDITYNAFLSFSTIFCFFNYYNITKSMRRGLFRITVCLATIFPNRDSLDFKAIVTFLIAFSVSSEEVRNVINDYGSVDAHGVPCFHQHQLIQLLLCSPSYVKYLQSLKIRLLFGLFPNRASEFLSYKQAHYNDILEKYRIDRKFPKPSFLQRMDGFLFGFPCTFNLDFYEIPESFLEFYQAYQEINQRLVPRRANYNMNWKRSDIRKRMEARPFVKSQDQSQCDPTSSTSCYNNTQSQPPLSGLQPPSSVVANHSYAR